MNNTPTIRIQKVRKNRTKRMFIIFSILAAALLICSIIAPLLCPYDPYAQDLSKSLQPPSAEHWLGTDRYGRDLLSRVIIGSQTSIYSTLILVAFMTVVGTVLGILAGLYGGILDTIIMRISDIFLAFPGLVFALAVAGALGGGVQNAIIALAAVGWPKFARLARSQTLAQKKQQYIDAARLSGNGTFKIIIWHLLPNIIGPIIVTAVLDIGTSMMEIAGLSYLGLGAMPPVAEWGSMMSGAREFIQTAPWVAFAPGIAIFISVVIFNMFGDTVRDYFDPRQRTK
ncbi:MAG: nickel transporter permease [Lachnospiraceae bacterium]|nr:nickel transporter permease [Lachnospiraceae bacterium]